MTIESAPSTQSAVELAALVGTIGALLAAALLVGD